jgi:hypothetical protein
MCAPDFLDHAMDVQISLVISIKHEPPLGYTQYRSVRKVAYKLTMIGTARRYPFFGNAALWH